jgi:hypothetical protein
MIRFEPDTLYDWLEDCEGFCYSFKRYCFSIAQAFGLDITFDSNSLKLAHQKWASDCEIWRTQHFPNETDALSHTKVVALLLHNLAPAPYISRVVDHEFTNDLDYQFCGSEPQYIEARKDLIAARDVVLALDFCLAVIAWYEGNRIDRKEQFAFRLTPDLRHDILSYLVARQTDPKAVYLFLEALFIRTPLSAEVPPSVPSSTGEPAILPSA